MAAHPAGVGMTPDMDLDYTDAEWAESGAEDALGETLPEEFIVLHRQWMWANQQRERPLSR